MPDNNDWLMHLDKKIDSLGQAIKEDFRTLHEKLGQKADRAELEKIQAKAQYLEVKQAGISAAVASLIIGAKALLFGHN
jgi:hypothetical protein